ncbi:MAG: radical SAM protein [Candidatus Dormibacteraeota bacterium]|nr:radical SAM protein [Candidatus Dormibacteraeota bacterium]
MTAIAEAVAGGLIGGRLWLYANYHCNLTCAYCLTESGPTVPRRELPLHRLPEITEEARAMGFTAIGVTGGEPFLVRGLPNALDRMAAILPTLVLSNGTFFGRALLSQLAPLGGRDFKVQISLDSAEPAANDEMRGPRNFAKVVEAIPRLIALGIGVRIATTTEGLEPAALERLCDLHRSLGIPDADHVVRPIVRRGRAVDMGLGVEAGPADLPAELTISTDGAFWSPFGPTVHGGRLDTDLLLTRVTRPLTRPAAALLEVAGAGSSRPGPEQPRIC